MNANTVVVVNATATAPTIPVAVPVQQQTTATESPAQLKSEQLFSSFEIAKDNFVSKEIRDPIIMKLNKGHTHYDENDWFTDWLFYMCNNHSLLAMCFAHRLHPYSRCQRIIAAFVTWSLAFILAVCWEASGWFGLSIWAIVVSSILLTAYGVFLAVVAKCSCCQSDNTMTGVRNAGHCLSSTILCVCFCHGLCLLIGGILWITYGTFDPSLSPSAAPVAFSGPHFTLNFLSSKLGSYLFIDPLMRTVIFGYKRSCEMKKIAEQ